jgi:hypothetical protein
VPRALLPDLRGCHGRYQCISSGLRQKPDSPAVRRWFPAAAAALLLVAATPTQSQAQDGAPTLSEPEAPSTLRPGRPARVAAHATRAEACQLRVSGAAVGTVDPGRAETIAWTWTVPDDARSASWNGSVACWSEADDVGRERPDVESRPFTIEVEGAPGGRSPLIEPGSLAVGVSDEETDARPWLERAADWGQLGTLIVTAVGLFAVRQQIRLAISQARFEQTAYAFDRLNNAEFKALWSKVLMFLRVRGEAECIDRIRQEVRVATGNDPLLRGDQAVVLNDVLAAHDTFEEAALLFNDRTLDQTSVIRGFGESISNAYVDSWWWIQYQREARGDAAAARWVQKRRRIVYAEWERMVRTMLAESTVPRANRQAEWRASTVRAICLPERDEATHAEWREAGDLSAAVGEAMRQAGADGLEDFLKAQVPGHEIPEPFTPVDRTIVIPPWPDLLPLPSRSRRTVAAAAAWWDRRNEEYGGSPLGYRLVRLDQWVDTCQRYQEIAWRLDLCRDKLTDKDLIGRLRKKFPPKK